MVNDWFYLRFQVDGNKLRAKAWKDGSFVIQPPNWQIDITDTSITSSTGNMSLRSINSGSTAHPVVSFTYFRVQTVGFSVHTWIKITTSTFSGSSSAKYVHFLSKSELNQAEWAFRIYSDDAPDNPGGMSFYVFNLDGDLGAGAGVRIGDRYPDNEKETFPGFERGRWYQIVATLWPGDATNGQKEGVSFYVDGRLLKSGTVGSYYDGTVPNSIPPDRPWQIFPKNGTSPVRLAQHIGGTNPYFNGEFDEVAIFSYRLSDDDVKDLYLTAVSP